MSGVLVIAPHADDEVLGCGGLVRKRVDAGTPAECVVMTIGDVSLGSGETKSTAAVREKELYRAASILGMPRPRILFPGYENRLDTLPMLDLISALDRLFAENSFEEIYLPYPSHHQDHRVTYDAAISALREKGRPGPRLVALYEYPYVGWPGTPIPGGRFYVDIEETLEAKREALAAYESQGYAPPHPISFEAVSALARFRGIECGVSYAELFYLLKQVER